MTGNNSAALNERKALLRVLFEGHGFSLAQLKKLSGLPLGRIQKWSDAEDWEPGLCVLLQTEQTAIPSEDGFENLITEKDMLATSMTVALRFLRESLDAQTGNAKTDTKLNKENRVKEVVSITRAIQVLEGLIANMETPKDEASLYPQDTLEFHRILEKQIENLADTGTAQ